MSDGSINQVKSNVVNEVVDLEKIIKYVALILQKKQ